MDYVDLDLSAHPRVDINHIYVGMVVIYDPLPDSTHYAMQRGTLAAVVNDQPDGVRLDKGYYEIEFIGELRSRPRNGQSNGAYHMRDFRVVRSGVPQFTTTDQAQAWLDQHTTPFPLGG